MRFLSEQDASPIHKFASRYVGGKEIADLRLDRLQSDGWSPLLIQEGLLIQFYQRVLQSDFCVRKSSYVSGFTNHEDPSRVDFRFKLNNPILIKNFELLDEIEGFLFDDCKIIALEGFQLFFVNLFLDWAIIFTKEYVKEEIGFQRSWLDNPYQDDPAIEDFPGLKTFWCSQFPNPDEC